MEATIKRPNDRISLITWQFEKNEAQNQEIFKTYFLPSGYKCDKQKGGCGNNEPNSHLHIF